MTMRWDTDEMRPTGPQTESSEERGFTRDRDVDDDDRGRSEELGDEPASDIADEGPGHRG
jgi:hypothetical protein